MDPVHHGCACQTPPVSSIESACTLGRERGHVLDALSFIEDDSIKLGFGMQQWASPGKFHVRGRVTTWVVLNPLFRSSVSGMNKSSANKHQWNLSIIEKGKKDIRQDTSKIAGGNVLTFVKRFSSKASLP